MNIKPVLESTVTHMTRCSVVSNGVHLPTWKWSSSMNSWAVRVMKKARKSGRISQLQKYIRTRLSSISMEVAKMLRWVCSSRSVISTFTSSLWVRASRNQKAEKRVADIRIPEAHTKGETLYRDAIQVNDQCQGTDDGAGQEIVLVEPFSLPGLKLDF